MRASARGWLRRMECKTTPSRSATAADYLGPVDPRDAGQQLRHAVGHPVCCAVAPRRTGGVSESRLFEHRGRALRGIEGGVFVTRQLTAPGARRAEKTSAFGGLFASKSQGAGPRLHPRRMSFLLADSSMPERPSSPPNPDRLTPPKCSSTPSASTSTMPAPILSATRRAYSSSVVKT